MDGVEQAAEIGSLGRGAGVQARSHGQMGRFEDSQAGLTGGAQQRRVRAVVQAHLVDKTCVVGNPPSLVPQG